MLTMSELKTQEILGSQNWQRTYFVNLFLKETVIDRGGRGSPKQGQIHSNHLLGRAFLRIDTNYNRKLYVFEREGLLCMGRGVS